MDRSFTPLADPAWRYVDKPSLDSFAAEDWAVMLPQRQRYFAGRQAREALAMLEATREDPSFGYMVNNYRHSLLSATRALRAGEDEEFVVVCLLHDIGFTIADASHGEFAAALLRPFVSERNHWMLAHHQIFQAWHCPTYPGIERDGRERFRGHPHFAWTARFVALFDQNTIDPGEECLPIEAFAPMVHRLFDRPPQPRRFEGAA
ncbi:MAG: hypothetical protein OHK0024_13760 [Thalassobaculales bacterium]